MEAKKSKVIAQGDWVFGEVEFPGSYMDIFSLSPHMVERAWGLLFIKLQPFSTSPKASPPNTFNI